MSEEKWYPNEQTLDGGDVASGRNTPMKSKPHKKAVLFDNQEKTQGAIINKPGTKRLYVLFTYFGSRVEKTTGLKDTPENRQKVRVWLDRIIEKRDAGQLIFAEAFPGASNEEKAHFAKLEGWHHFPKPNEVLFGHYVKGWRETILDHWEDDCKKDDYKQAIDCWILPYFTDKTFFQISHSAVVEFIRTLTWKEGSKAGQPLSTSRIKNILTPLRKIWRNACQDHQWMIFNPFDGINDSIPKTPPKKREGFRFDDAMLILKYMDPWYRPIAELMLLTGMINSELAGLKKSHIRKGNIHVRETVVRGRAREKTKTTYRTRQIPITEAIGKRLDILVSRAPGEHIVTTPCGTTFRASNFLNNVWYPALDESELPHRVPYGLRHSFAAWALTIGIDLLKLVSLMGHGSKKMIYEVYGDYVEGLEEDYEKILAFFGEDFLRRNVSPDRPQTL